MSENVEIIIGVLIFIIIMVKMYFTNKNKSTIINSGDKKSIIMNESIIEKVVDKVFSGSFSMLVLVGSTYCIIILSCIYLMAKGRIDAKDFFLVVSGTGTVFMALWKDYNNLPKPTVLSTTQTQQVETTPKQNGGISEKTQIIDSSTTSK